MCLVNEQEIIMNDDEKRLEEFKEASSFHRLQNAILLGQITVFLAANTGLLVFLSGLPASVEFLTVGLKLCGILLSFLLLAIADRAYQYSHMARSFAGKIGEELGFKIYTEKWIPPGSWLPPATIAMKGFYIVVGLLWLVSLICQLVAPPINS